MSVIERALTTRKNVLKKIDKVSWVGPLLLRITVGVVFIGTGWGKLHSLGDVTQYFAELGIPAPGLNALVASTTELVGGICVLAGVMTRLAALPLAFTMLIAILTAKRADVTGLSSLLGLEETMYLVAFLALAFLGAGKASIDDWLARRLDQRAPLRPLLRPRDAPTSSQAA
jgi:putative oxidoreductase